MRLTPFEIQSIVKSSHKVFGNKSKVYLFGSRIDDTAKGGDIDLYIETEALASDLQSKFKFLIELKSLIGEQKIDVITSTGSSRLIEKEALAKGLLL